MHGHITYIVAGDQCEAVGKESNSRAKELPKAVAAVASKCIADLVYIVSD